MMQFKRANAFAVPALTALWNLGYADFFVPSQFTERQMASFVWGSDIDLAHSVVAVDGDGLTGFSLLGVRGVRGWIGGVGVAPEYRGCGRGSALFAAHMDVIRQETALASVRLEVLVQNWAYKLYDRSGFRTVRRLSYLEGRLPDRETAAADAIPGVGTAADGVTAGAPGALLAHSERLHGPWPAVWQREPADLGRCVPPLERALWTGSPAAPDGYLLYNLHGREIWIADAAAGASAPVATRLIDHLAQLHPGFTVAIGDEPEGSPFHQALTALGCHEAQARWEMHCPVP